MEDNQLHAIEEKLQLLMQRYQKAVVENNKLKIELQQMNDQLIRTQKENESLALRLDASKTGIQSWGEEDKKLLQVRIDDYLKEIAHCLDLLNA